MHTTSEIVIFTLHFMKNQIIGLAGRCVARSRQRARGRREEGRPARCQSRWAAVAALTLALCCSESSTELPCLTLPGFASSNRQPQPAQLSLKLGTEGMKGPGGVVLSHTSSSTCLCRLNASPTPQLSHRGLAASSCPPAATAASLPPARRRSACLSLHGASCAF